MDCSFTSRRISKFQLVVQFHASTHRICHFQGFKRTDEAPILFQDLLDFEVENSMPSELNDKSADQSWASAMDLEEDVAAAAAFTVDPAIDIRSSDFMLLSEPERISILLREPFHNFGNEFQAPIDMSDPRLHPIRISKDFDSKSGYFLHLDFDSFRPSDEVALDCLASSHPDGNLSSITPRPRRSTELDQEIFLEFPSIPTGIFAECTDARNLICAHRTVDRCGFWAQCFNFKDRKSWLIPGWDRRLRTVQSFFDLLAYLEKCLPLAPPQLPGCRMCRRMIIEAAVGCYERNALASHRGSTSDYNTLREY